MIMEKQVTSIFIIMIFLAIHVVVSNFIIVQGVDRNTEKLRGLQFMSQTPVEFYIDAIKEAGGRIDVISYTPEGFVVWDYYPTPEFTPDCTVHSFTKGSVGHVGKTITEALRGYYSSLIK